MIQVGQEVGNYKVTAKLGEGGMGVVYLAEHPRIARKVALKAIHPELSRNAEVVSRFETEAKAVNQIGNEHIVDITDYGTTPDGEFYFVMEFLQGDSLADRLRREKLLQPNRALQIAAQVADALSASHQHGIVHRDLKPENIYLITRGQSPDFVKVLDFGLAKLTQGEDKVSHKTRTGSVMGTPYYMAPEQCEGRAGVDHRADIYSLGVILFEMMTGKVPFGGEGYGEIIVKHLTQPPPSPRSIIGGITPAQEAVVLRALSKKREERFASMDEFRAAILDPERYAGSSPVSLLPSAPQRTGDVSGSISLRGGEAGDVKQGPMPSTFRHAGEMMEEEIQVPRSRKGVVIGVVAAAAVAAAGALFFLKRQPSEGVAAAQQPPALAPTPAPAPPAPAPVVTPPPAPQTVKISFVSDPPGATVVAKGSGETLGTTPFEKELPQGKDRLAFVFRKASFEDQESSIVPEAAGSVSAALQAIHGKPAVTAEESGHKSRSHSGGRKGREGRDSKKTPPQGGNKPLDDDAVLEPSFKF